MISFDDYANENKIQHNLKGLYIPDHPYRVLITGRSRPGKTNALLNLINNQPGIDKIYLYAKDPYEYLINKHEKVALNYYDNPNAFTEYSNNMQDVYKDIDEYNADKERKILIFFDDIIADMITNKELNSIGTDLFIRGRKLNISFVFIKQSYLRFQRMLE